MDDKRLSEIEGRLEAASDDWRITDTTPPDGRMPEWVLIEGPRGFCDEQGCAMANIALSDMSDAQLIAHAPDDLSDLLAEVRRLQPIVEAAMAYRAHYDEYHMSNASMWNSMMDACRKAREGQ